MKCYWCRFDMEHGVRVCRGCNADVVYRALRRDLRRAFKVGAVLGALPAFGMVGLMVQRRVDGVTPLLAGLAVMVSCGVLAMIIQARRLRGRVRFFRRTNL